MTDCKLRPKIPFWCKLRPGYFLDIRKLQPRYFLYVRELQPRHLVELSKLRPTRVKISNNIFIPISSDLGLKYYYNMGLVKNMFFMLFFLNYYLMFVGLKYSQIFITMFITSYYTIIIITFFKRLIFFYSKT